MKNVSSSDNQNIVISRIDKNILITISSGINIYCTDEDILRLIAEYTSMRDKEIEKEISHIKSILGYKDNDLNDVENKIDLGGY